MTRTRSVIDRGLFVPRTPADTKGLRSTIVLSPIQVRPSEPKEGLSTITAREALPKGARLEEVAMPTRVFSRTGMKYGRSMDGLDLMKGYTGVVYTDLAQYDHVFQELGKRLPSFMDDYKAQQPYLYSMEESDFLKLSAQRGLQPGAFMQLPANEENQLWNPPDDALSRALDVVLDKFASLCDKRNTSTKELMELDTNPATTQNGLPIMASGADSVPVRLLTTKAMPMIDFQAPAGKTLESWNRFLWRFGFPDYHGFSSVISSRTGPMAKWQSLSYPSSSGYSSRFESKGVYTRFRVVHMVPLILNLLLAPVNYQIKRSRINGHGLWHTPAADQAVFDSWKGKKLIMYENDFSALDQSVAPGHRLYVYEGLKKRGFDAWSIDLAIELERNLPVLYPSFNASPVNQTSYQGPKGVLSGEKGTSNMDTIIAIAVVLAALEEQIPGISKKWSNDQFFILSQGDDGLFGLPSEMDGERFTKTCASRGYTVKLAKGQVFLKAVTPMDMPFKNPVRLLSRILQQSFFNEDAYPDSIAGRLQGIVGLSARMEGIQHHPMFRKFWSTFGDLFQDFPYVAEMTSEERTALRNGAPIVSQRTVNLLMEKSSDDYIAKLLARADSDPSAAKLLRFFLSHGVEMESISEALAGFQKKLVDNLLSKPTIEDWKQFTHRFRSGKFQ